jgi:hypothetical protein
MTVIPNQPGKTKKQPAKAKTVPAVAPAITLDVDMSGVEVELANLASSVKSYVVNAVDGDNSLNLFTGTSTYPVKVRLLTDDGCDVFDGIVGTLEEQGDKQAAALERIATAFERIADAMQVKP